MPSPASPTSRTNVSAPLRSTVTGRAGVSTRITSDRKATLSATVTEKTTLPRPRAVSSLWSRPTTAENVLPGPGNRTTTLLTAWQYRPRL